MDNIDFTEPEVITIPKGQNIKSAKQFITHFNKALKDHITIKQFEQKILIERSQSRVTKGGFVYVEFDPYVAAILGCKEKILINEKNEGIYGDFKIDIYHHVRYMYLYCNICDYSYTGLQLTQLLRVITIDFDIEKIGSLISEEYVNEHFYNINLTNLDNIQLQLRDSYGELYPLDEGRTVATLPYVKN